MFDGHRLRAIRKSRGFTTDLLAFAIKRSNSCVVLYETGHRTPPPEVEERMAAVLGVPPSDFYDDDPVAAQ